MTVNTGIIKSMALNQVYLIMSVIINFKGEWPSPSVLGRMPVFGIEENIVVCVCV